MRATLNNNIYICWIILWNCFERIQYQTKCRSDNPVPLPRNIEIGVLWLCYTGTSLCTAKMYRKKPVELTQLCTLFRVPSRTWKIWRFAFYLSRSRNSLECAPQKWEILEKTRKLAENMDWNINIFIFLILFLNINIYITFLYDIWDSSFQVLCSCEFRKPFGDKIVCTKSCRMAVFTWTKFGDNVEFYGKTGSPDN